MWNWTYLSRIDGRMLVVIFALMGISLLVVSAHTTSVPLGWQEAADESFWTPLVRKQVQGFLLGFAIFFFFAGFDYNKLREWTWVLYALMLVALVGVFFTESIQRVHRWYRIPWIGMNIQPSEWAKLIVVIALSWFLERRQDRSRALSSALLAGLIAFIPFVLILKQPDLGTALVLFPITLVMFYFGNLHPWMIRFLSGFSLIALFMVSLIFVGVIPHESARPYATKILKEYQFDRLSPSTHHQKAATSAIALGGLTGTGWRQSSYTGGGWLPAPYTDSVFSAFGEEFGLLGLLILLTLFYALIYFSFQVAAVAKDPFGRLLAVGIAGYLAMHILANIGMMSGLLPITGVPLVLISYGGSSIVATMTALGILQSIYSRRFMF